MPSVNKPALPLPHRPLSPALHAAWQWLLAGLLPLAVFGVGLLMGQTARAQAPAPTPAWAEQVRRLASDQITPAGAPQAAGTHGGALRVAVEIGSLDAHLRLAPCRRIEPQWPAGVRPWGRIRVALRCVEGPVSWKVYLPVTVRAYGRAPVTAAALPAGTVIEAAHLAEAEVDLAAAHELPQRDPAALLGRALARALPAGQPVRQADLRQRQWFAMGDLVRVVAAGPGFQVSGEGQAITPGIEGQTSRVRTPSGRIVTGRAVGDRRLEVAP
jgi:flagella basal body P-ring formation protein FlgA